MPTAEQIAAKNAYENPDSAAQAEQERLAEIARQKQALIAAKNANERDPNAPKLTPEEIWTRNNAAAQQAQQPAAAPQRSAYDLRREQIASEREAEQARRQEALKERLTSQGLNVGGLAEKLSAMERGNVGSEFGRRLGEVDIEELMGKERMSEAEKNRALSTRSLALQERLGLGGMELQRRGQDIGVSEAEKQRLYGTSERLGSQSFAAQQQALQNVVTTNIAKMNIGVQLKQLAQQAGQFATQQEFNKYAFDKGIDQQEANRAWDIQKNAIEGARADRQFSQTIGIQLKEMAQRLTEKGMDQAFAKDMANLNAMLTNTNLRFQDTLDDQNRADDIRAKSYYAMGQSGKELTAIELKGLQTNDPIAYNSYMAGKNGIGVDELEQKNKIIQNYWNARMVGLDPDSENYRNLLTGLAQDMATSLGLSPSQIGLPQVGALYSTSGFSEWTTNQQRVNETAASLLGPASNQPNDTEKQGSDGNWYIALNGRWLINNSAHGMSGYAPGTYQ